MNLLLNPDSPLMGLQWKRGSEIHVVLIDSGTQKTAPIFFASLILFVLCGTVVPGKTPIFSLQDFILTITIAHVVLCKEEEKLFHVIFFSGKLLYMPKTTLAEGVCGSRLGARKSPRSTSDILPSLIIVSFQAFSSLSFQNCIRECVLAAAYLQL